MGQNVTPEFSILARKDHSTYFVSLVSSSYDSTSTSFPPTHTSSQRTPPAMFNNSFFIVNGQNVYVPLLAPSVPRNAQMTIFSTADLHLVILPVATTVSPPSTAPAPTSAPTGSSSTSSASALPAFPPCSDEIIR